MAFWKKPFRFGLQARITVIATIGLTALFIVIGYIGLRNQTASMDVVLQERVALAQTVAAYEDYHLGYLLDELNATASQPGFDLSDGDLRPEQAALADLYRSGKFTYDVFLTDMRGLVLAVEPQTLRAGLVGSDLSKHPHILQALETGQPQVSGVISGVGVPGPLVSLVVPLKNMRGEIVGLIGRALDPSGPVVSGFIGPMALGETGYAQVVDGQGMVVASTHPGRAGTPGEHHDLILSLIQRGEPTVSVETPVTEEGREFHEVIAFAPIPRFGWGVTVEQDRDEALAPIIQARNQILLAYAATLALAIVLVWLTMRQVTRPVLTLAGAARRMASGDLSTPLPQFGSDEIGQLGRDFEAMRQELAAWSADLDTAVRKRTRELSILYAIDRAAAQSLQLEKILDDALDRLIEVLEVEGDGIYLLEPDGETLTLRAHRGLSDEFVESIRSIKLGEGISGRAAAERKPIVLDVADYPTERLAPFIIHEGFQTLASTPLVSAGHLVGVLNLGSRRPRLFPPEEVELLTAIGRQLGGAVANVRLYQEVLASEQEYRTLVENSTELIWALDAEARFTFINRQAEEVSGYKAEDWLGKSFAPLIAPPDDLPRVQRIFLETLAGKAQSYEVGVYRPDASVIHLSVNTTPLYRDGHAQVVGTTSFARDITMQQEAEASLQQRLAELSALFTVSAALRKARTLEEMLPIILRSTLEVLRCDQGILSLVDRQSGEVAVRVTTPGQESLLGTRTKIGQGIAGRVVLTGRPMLPADFADLQAPEFVRSIAGEPRTVICYPLQTAAEVVGTLYLSAPLPREFSEGELKLLVAIADMAANAIHRAGLFEQLEHRVHELTALFDVGKMVTATLRIEDVQEFVVRAATRAVTSEGCYLFLWDELKERLVLRARVGFLAKDVGRIQYRLGEGLAGWVFLESRTASVPDLAVDPRWKREPEVEAPLDSGQALNALVVPLRVGNKMLGVLGVINKIGAPAFTPGDESLLTTLAGQMAVAIENARLYEDVRGLSVAAIRALAAAIDARDPYTRGHSEDVARLAVQLARELGWNAADLELLEFAALLHDVGKIAVPDAILRKDGPLTPDEWNIIRLHPYYSAQIIKPVEPLQRIIPWVYHHQERWDGTGYPDGLKGEAIPLAARIIAVVDAFNAMTSDRPYRKALPVPEALAEIRRGTGGQFDPQLAKAFLQTMKRT